MDKIDDKILEIEKYLDELESFAPDNFQEYIDNFEKKAACERYFEKIIEAVVDLAYLIIRHKNLKIPEEEKETFGVLSKANIIPKTLEIKLKEAKGMRNIISHQYGNVDDEIVFESITSQIQEDVRMFVKYLKKIIKE